MSFLSQLLDTLCPLATAVVLGGSLGFERELHRRWAGLRTHILVALASAVFVIGSTYVSENAPDAMVHTIQGIAAGVGFIGAGTILKLSDKLEVKGLTTASSIWIAAAIGTAAGLRAYTLAVCGTILALATLTAVQTFERWLEPSAKATRDSGGASAHHHD